MKSYLARRDQYRAEATPPRPPKWQQSTPLLAATIFQQAKVSIKAAAQNIRVFWDKSWHGGNQAKGANTPEDQQITAQCPLCHQPDSQRHWLLECQEPAVAAARRSYIAQIKRVAREEDNHRRNIQEPIVDIAINHAQGEQVWTGMWSEEQRQQLKRDIARRQRHPTADFTELTIRQYRKALLDISKIMAEGANHIWAVRQEQHKSIVTPRQRRRQIRSTGDHRQPPITLFFQRMRPSTNTPPTP